MKRIALLFIALVITVVSVRAQEEEESTSSWSVGADVVSSYVWRGTKFGKGPAIQPSVEFSTGGLAIGAWGSVCTSTEEAAEMDLYISYGFDFGLSFGISDYYFPGVKYFEYSGDTASHALELNVGYEIGGFSIAGNYMLNSAPAGVGVDNDLYFEAGYSFEHLDIFVGAGNGWYTVEDPGESDQFGIVNVGVGTSKDIKITEFYSLPVFGQVILNPQAESFNIVAGFSF